MNLKQKSSYQIIPCFKRPLADLCRTYPQRTVLYYFIFFSFKGLILQYWCFNILKIKEISTQGIYEKQILYSFLVLKA